MCVLLSVAFGMMILRSVLGFRTPPPCRRMPSSWRSIAATSPWVSRPTVRQGVRRALALSSSNAPVVEVSPSDHGTTPIADFGRSGSVLDDRLVRSLRSPTMNITVPTPVQSHAMPLLLNRYDVMASSATGSGKTMMFGLPLLNQLLTLDRGKAPNNKAGGTTGQPMALVISPTRELAVQTAGVFNSFAKDDASLRARINVCLATGGSDTRNQRQMLPRCNVLVGTPGRICQFLDERKLSLQSVNYLVIDEADRLLDMGFEPQLTRIARSFSRTVQKQSVLCSATFPAGVQRLAADFLDPSYYFVSVGKVGSTHSSIDQRFEWINLYGGKGGKNGKNPKVDAVVRNVERFWTSGPAKDQSSVLVFTNTKDGAELYGKALSSTLGNKKRIRVIHGDKPQSERNRAIEEFKSGKASLLVATDVAARGLDVNSIGLVVQADAPRNVDTYTHRIGRTGRAGRSGHAVTLLDSKSGFGIASGLVDLLQDADLDDNIPSWLQGMAHIANARELEEDMKIQAGSVGIQGGTSSDSSASDSEVTNDEFSLQDFRRTAVKDSYGLGKDTAYRNFEEEAYNSDMGNSNQGQAPSIIFSSDSSINTSLDDEDGTFASETPSSTTVDVVASFERKEPSRQLLQAITEISGSAVLDDTPDKSIIDQIAKRGQKLRFEYLGLFPFHLISPLLMTSRSRDANNDQVKILMVAEKPSIAKSIADALSGKRGPSQRRGISRALPVYEFTTSLPDRIDSKNGKALVRVTSVVGHIYSLGFDFDAQNKEKRNNPRDYFRLPVTKKEEGTTSKLRIVDHLRALAGDSDHLVLWLDCDPEGENIAHEVMAVTRRAIHSNGSSPEDGAARIHRAKFSAITQKAIQDSFRTLDEPDPNLSRSVDARQELDLRIGVALTRLLTGRCVNIARKRFSPSTRMVSYGPCQTPALSFCVDRLREIEEFRPTKYWKVQVNVRLLDDKNYPLTWIVPTKEAVEDTRSKNQIAEKCATYNQQAAELVVQRAKRSDVFVKALTKSSESISPPVGLNTVALLEAGSKAMGMSPKQVMNVAEKLYSAGLISYPRTETTRYDPNGFDARAMLREHTNSPDWGRSASYLFRTRKSGKPPLRGKDSGDHPPITPLKCATREQVGGGAAWRLYEFIVRNFIGSLHNDLVFTRTTASLGLSDSRESEFELELVTVDSPGFADACSWVLRDIGATSFDRTSNVNLIQEGQRLRISKASIVEKSTRPPRFVQEHELIRLMDSNRIGTDASMAGHVSNIVDRGYVMLCDETGEPLRPPRPPGKRRHNLPRQIGRYMIPTPLGTSLLGLFEHDPSVRDFDSPAMLSHPSIRRQMEEEVKEIAAGKIEKDYCLEKNLDWFEARYAELENSLTRERVGEFGQGLMSMRDYLRKLQSFGTFEPKVAAPKQQQQPRKSFNHKNRQRNTSRGKKGQGQSRKRRVTVN